MQEPSEELLLYLPALPATSDFFSVFTSRSLLPIVATHIRASFGAGFGGEKAVWVAGARLDI